MIPSEVPRARLADYVSQTARGHSTDTGLGDSSNEEEGSGGYEVDESEDGSEDHQEEQSPSRKGRP